MGVLDFIVGIVAVIILIVLVIVVIVVVFKREARAQRKSDDEHRLREEELKLEEEEASRIDPAPTPVHPPHYPGCQKSCGCPCGGGCHHDHGLRDDDHGKLETYETPCSKYSGSSDSDSHSSDSSSWSSVSVNAPNNKSCACSECRIPQPPQLNCVTYRDGAIEMACGSVQNSQGPGSYFLQWFPQSFDTRYPITGYAVYVRAGSAPVTKTLYDFKYFVNSSMQFFTTPNLDPNTTYNFIVTASNECGESDASIVQTSLPN